MKCLARLLGCVATILVAMTSVPALAQQGGGETAATITHILDYVAVDYPDAVVDGKVTDDGEYQEQREFAGQVVGLLRQMAPQAGQEELVRRALELQARIDAKAPGREITALARAIGADFVRAYDVAVSPKRTPDIARAATLFQAHCAACHGTQGRGEGPATKGMDPAPSSFHAAARMDKRSIHGLYNTVSLGVKGTSMRAFSEIPDADRWALAFLVAGLRDTEDRKQAGQALWKQGVGATELGNLQRLVTATAETLSAAGKQDLDSVRAFLTAHPEALAASGPAPLVVARTKLAQAMSAYRNGDRTAARQQAITAYLEGFELVEAGLDNVDPGLRRRVEEVMMALRSDIDAAKSNAELEERMRQANALIDDAERKLAEGGMSPMTTFTSSLLILLREGLEAILVLAAIVAFVRKTGRADALPYIHAGWVAALVLGVATWFAADRFQAISGASREVTEGVAAILAAVMLLYVGLWLHNRSHAQAWQAFIRDRVTEALGRRTLWSMAGISFLAVYRELFEIILFYETLLAQAGDALRPQVTAGIAVSLALLVLTGVFILKYSARLPIGLFFSATSWLLVAMAVVFVGHGVAALQEAGLLASTPVAFFSAQMLGIHPNLQGLAAQGAMLALTLAVLLRGRVSRQPAAP